MAMCEKEWGEIVIYQTHIKGRDVFGANNQNSRFTVVRIFRYVLDHMAVLHLNTHTKKSMLVFLQYFFRCYRTKPSSSQRFVHTAGVTRNSTLYI